jgi:hypothetical protein
MTRMTSAQRRAEQEADERDRVAHERPNIPSTPRHDGGPCANSKFGVHDFSMLGPAAREVGCDGADFKVARCWYCSELSPYAKQRLAAFRARQS